VLPNELALETADIVARSLHAERLKVSYGSHVDTEVKTRMYATYIMPERFESIGGTRVNTGFCIRNAIDGTLAFGVEGFTYREACKNGVLIGSKTLARFYRMHTAKFEIHGERIIAVVERVVQDMDQILEQYAKLDAMKLNREIAEKLVESRLYRKHLPPYIETEKKKLVSFEPATLWQTYNDITQLIWHNAEINMTIKHAQFRELHRAMPILRA